MPIPFTQYLRPNGRKTPVTIERPKEIEDRAFKMIDCGYSFEVEELSAGAVSLTVTHSGADEPIAIEVVPNGPEVPVAVDRLISRWRDN